jgi:hypothetical protein
MNQRKGNGPTLPRRRALGVPWTVVGIKQDWKAVFPPQEKAQ